MFSKCNACRDAQQLRTKVCSCCHMDVLLRCAARARIELKVQSISGRNFDDERPTTCCAVLSSLGLENVFVCICTFLVKSIAFPPPPPPSVLQGVSKVLEPFVFAICSKSLGAQKKQYCQIKAEILKFMWVCGKSQFE
jgi:hypothetical protein